MSSLIKKLGVNAVFQITSGKQMTNNSTPCANRINFGFSPSYLELYCLDGAIVSSTVGARTEDNGSTGNNWNFFLLVQS